MRRQAASDFVHGVRADVDLAPFIDEAHTGLQIVLGELRETGCQLRRLAGDQLEALLFVPSPDLLGPFSAE